MDGKGKVINGDLGVDVDSQDNAFNRETVLNVNISERSSKDRAHSNLYPQIINTTITNSTEKHSTKDL